jgi:hypothetical protein
MDVKNLKDAYMTMLKIGNEGWTALRESIASLKRIGM